MPRINKSRAEIATIDCTLVTIVAPELNDDGSEKLDASGNVTYREFGFDTSTQVSVEAQTEEQDAVRLVVKGILRAQKPRMVTITGTQITLTESMFNPELVQILQGGTLEWGSEATGTDSQTLAKYTPPVAGSSDRGHVFTLNLYSAQYDSAGLVVNYEKTSFPNCQGEPVTFNSEDWTFRTPEYTINSYPRQTEAPYTIQYVTELPELYEQQATVTYHNVGYNNGEPISGIQDIYTQSVRRGGSLTLLTDSEVFDNPISMTGVGSDVFTVAGWTDDKNTADQAVQAAVEAYEGVYGPATTPEDTGFAPGSKKVFSADTDLYPIWSFEGSVTPQTYLLNTTYEFWPGASISAYEDSTHITLDTQGEVIFEIKPTAEKYAATYYLTTDPLNTTEGINGVELHGVIRVETKTPTEWEFTVWLPKQNNPARLKIENCAWSDELKTLVRADTPLYYLSGASARATYHYYSNDGYKVTITNWPGLTGNYKEETTYTDNAVTINNGTFTVGGGYVEDSTGSSTEAAALKAIEESGATVKNMYITGTYTVDGDTVKLTIPKMKADTGATGAFTSITLSNVTATIQNGKVTATWQNSTQSADIAITGSLATIPQFIYEDATENTVHAILDKKEWATSERGVRAFSAGDALPFRSEGYELYEVSPFVNAQAQATATTSAKKKSKK